MEQALEALRCPPGETPVSFLAGGEFPYETVDDEGNSNIAWIGQNRILMTSVIRMMATP